MEKEEDGRPQRRGCKVGEEFYHDQFLVIVAGKDETGITNKEQSREKAHYNIIGIPLHRSACDVVNGEGQADKSRQKLSHRRKHSAKIVYYLLI